MVVSTFLSFMVSLLTSLSTITQIMIRNLKTNTLHPEDTETNRTLKFTLLSPSRASNIQFSVPHRLLAIAIRRNALMDINTLEELFESQLQNIRVKPEFLGKPVLLSAVSKGTAVDANRPLRATALTEYLKLRGQRVGCPQGTAAFSESPSDKPSERKPSHSTLCTEGL